MDKTENKEKPLYQYIESSKGLADLLTRLRPHSAIAVDTEADSLHAGIDIFTPPPSLG